MLGGGDDHNSSRSRELVGVIVERCNGRGEAMGCAAMGDLVREVLSRAQVGAKRDEQGGVVACAR